MSTLPTWEHSAFWYSPCTVKCYSCVLLWHLTGKMTTSADLPGTAVGGRRNTLELGYHDVIETGAYVVVGSTFL